MNPYNEITRVPDALKTADNDRYFEQSRRGNSTGHRKYRRCRAQGRTPGAFGAGSKKLRVAEPMDDPRFMSRGARWGAALRALISPPLEQVFSPSNSSRAKAAGHRRTAKLKARRLLRERGIP